MIAQLVIAAIRLYQRRFPARWKRHCLYTPNCSEYTVLAIEKYGLWIGARKSIERIRRCRPPVLEWQDEP